MSGTAYVHPGRLVMVDIEGTRLDADTAAFLHEHRIRAVCLFRKNLRQEAEIQRLCRPLHSITNYRNGLAFQHLPRSGHRKLLARHYFFSRSTKINNCHVSIYLTS